MEWFYRYFKYICFTIVSIFLLQGCFTLEYSPYDDEEDDYDSLGAYSGSTHPKDGAFRYRKLIEWGAQKYKVDYYLFLALVQAESSGNPDAVSSANCRGLTQLSLPTAKQYDSSLSYEDLHDPKTNIDIAGQHMAYLRKLIRRVFPNANLEKRVVLNAAAWNAGWGRVRRAQGIPRISETQIFTRRVLKYYRKYRWN